VSASAYTDLEGKWHIWWSECARVLNVCGFDLNDVDYNVSGSFGPLRPFSD